MQHGKGVRYNKGEICQGEKVTGTRKCQGEKVIGTIKARLSTIKNLLNFLK